MNSTITAVYPVFDSAAIDLPTKENWCTTHKSSCTLICMDEYGDATQTLQNDCDPASLQWTCLCQGNRAPNLSVYSLTVPYFECVQVVQECIHACPLGNNECASACNSQKSCGATTPNSKSHPSTFVSTTAPSATSSTAAAEYTGFGVSSKSSPKSNAPKSLPRMSILTYFVTFILLLLFGRFNQY